MYKEDFENIQQKQSRFHLSKFFFICLAKCKFSRVIGRGPRTHMWKLLIFFKSRLNKSFKLCTKFVHNGRSKFICKLVFQKNTSSRCVLSTHKLSKTWPCSLRSGKIKHFKKDKLAYLPKNLNSAPSPTAGKPKLRDMEEDLSVNHRTHFVF